MLKEVGISLRPRETRFVFHVPISNSFKSDAKASALGTRCKRSVHSVENLTSPLMYFRIPSGAFAWKRGPSMNIFCLYVPPSTCLSIDQIINESLPIFLDSVVGFFYLFYLLH